MFLKRNPWIVPIAIVLVCAGLYVLIVGSRSSIDQSELLGAWVQHAVVMIAIAALAIFVYRMLRRSHAAGDEAGTLRDERRGR